MPISRYDTTTQTRGASVRTARLALGMSLREVAYFAETTEASLSRIERGLQEPSIALKVRLARVLGEPVSELFPLLPPAEDAGK